MDIRKHILLAAFIGISCETWCSPKDTTAVAEHNDRWINLLAAYRDNPSFMDGAFRTSYSELGLKVDFGHESKALIQQMGDRHLLGKAYVDSYLKLGKKGTVWGGASYQMGEKRNLRFCSTSDYELLYPYVMADTVGGNMRNEQYAFFGGYSLTTGRWAIGANLKFRAEHEYRMIDPRPRGIATDLRMAVGANVSLWRYRVGLGAGANIYKQTNDVEFYNELGVKPEYHMTGLGTDYLRFAGANRTCYYKGLGFATDLRLRPRSGSGVFLSAEYQHTPYKKILTDLNALPISTLYVDQSRLLLGWKQEGRIGWSVFGAMDARRRQGDEHIAGSASGSEYKSLITLTMYRHYLYDYYVGAAMHIGGKHRWTLEAKAGQQEQSSRYIMLERLMEVRKAYVQANLQYVARIAGCVFCEWDSAITRMVNKSSRRVMPYATMDKLTTALTDDTFAVMAGSYTSVSSRIKIMYQPKMWKGAGPFVEVGGSHAKLSDRVHAELKATVGVAF
ncbi:DUF6850 family outer membrane beta-barrel protein [Prevotella sp. S7-1-8]|uniref:DUF6850 family outer membrane beta-barrel protein n=1 Tax=Prevotella sp. S7-1-8 TaxID=1284775 RepID=UPI000B27ED2A|nr:DUF6850 family outer membrane beta-barrel protein [Prevotella sp. S7-1-8]